MREDASFKPQTVKIRLGVQPERDCEKKSITRTGKRDISHIWGQAPCKAIAIKFCTGVDVHEVVTYTKFDL